MNFFLIATKWLAGFFEEADGSSSSRRLNTILAHFVAFMILLVLAGVVVGLVLAHKMDKDSSTVLQLVGMLLDTIKMLTGLTLTGGTVNYLVGKHLDNKAPPPAPDEAPTGGDQQ